MSNKRKERAYINPHRLNKLTPLLLGALFILGCFAAVSLAAPHPEGAQGSPFPPEASFRIHYGAVLKNLPPTQRIQVWIPLPRDDAYQSIKITDLTLPAPYQIYTEKKYGNQLIYFEVQPPSPEQLKFSIDYLVKRLQVQTVSLPPHSTSPCDLKPYLQANRLVPITGPITRLLEGKKAPATVIDSARQIYNLVLQHLDYDKSRPGWGKGDALWACNSGYGNCTDFHSLFIALARFRHIPARFEIGFLIPTHPEEGKLSGYHCWAWFYTPDHGWVPVDISEADKHPALTSYYFGHLSPHRLALTTGRDLVLTPPQNGPPLNFWVYPYVEVGGKPWSQLDYNFRYQNLMLP